MTKCIWIALLLLGSSGVAAQETPALDTFTSPDGAFQFHYPQNYELLVGDRMLRATQGKNLETPVCDFSTALVCVIYPVERAGARLDGAGFSVDAVPGMTSEADCLAYADRSGQKQVQSSATGINGREFRYASTSKKDDGHVQSAELYRAFQNDRCYELHIVVSTTDDSSSVRPSQRSLEQAIAETARDSLRLILSSFAFRQ